ncbi:MAG: ATP-dependent helicase RhlE [Desulfovibrionales bacterium]|nr:ATP-dependent helicase RhlE [Desulfovibrionales bacterium]
MSFDVFHFDNRIMAGVKRAGYTIPTPIQTQAIPDVLDGRDLIGLAETGTGKTAAFALPILQNMLAAKCGGRGPLKTLILAPTRELALQIHQSFIALGRETGLRSAAVFGGVGFGPQIKALRQACICVACPGRLLDLVQRGQADLRQIETVVLDEADRMLDMGFAPDIKKIMGLLKNRKQTLLFSATMPRDIKALADELLTDPSVVQVANTRVAPKVTHTLYPVCAHEKPRLMEDLLAQTGGGSVLVFTRTKHRAKSLATKLGKQGYSTTFLQGNLSQNRRQRAMDEFRTGKRQIMVATDIAARGIDCDLITHVINFDVPDSAETYTHRIGRTGRAGRTGEALTLVSSEEAGRMRAIERTLGLRIERIRAEGYEAPEVRPADDRPANRRRGKPQGKFYGKPKPRGQRRPQNGPERTPSRGAAA